VYEVALDGTSTGEPDAEQFVAEIVVVLQVTS
jgi:hypothetical protein